MQQRSPYASADTPVLYPSYTRPKKHRVVAGVAAGLAVHLKVDVGWVRVAFVVAAFFSGMGIGVYALLWMFTRVSDDADEVPANPNFGTPTYLVLVALGLVGATVTTTTLSGISPLVLVALAVVAVGAFVAWQSMDRDNRTLGNTVALVAGVVLVFTGVLAMALLWDNGGFGGAVASVLVTLMGVGVLVVPLVMRLTASLVQAREEKAVATQRTEIASRLHDSVLQTLALIQKRAEHPEEVARLARGQERELRAWLFGAEEKASTTVFAALNKAAGEVEDLVGVRIAPVTVGEDVEYDERTEPLVMAAREAMLNAGKHAGVDTIDVYAENLAGELAIYVRDRGPGFDIQTIPDDRHGVRDSIIGRMERADGKATIRSKSTGTEVMVSVPVP